MNEYLLRQERGRWSQRLGVMPTDIQFNLSYPFQLVHGAWVRIYGLLSNAVGRYCLHRPYSFFGQRRSWEKPRAVLHIMYVMYKTFLAGCEALSGVRRERMGLLPHTKVGFTLEWDVAYLRKVDT